ncbi:MAG: bactofilin family protein [Pseudomonadales bacterium]
MFGDKKRGDKEEVGITFIAPDCEFVGELHFRDELIVNGLINGNVYADDSTSAVVRIHEKGLVAGEVTVPTVVVNGKVTGNIWASERVELTAKAEVIGDVHYHILEIEKGARVDGQLFYSENAQRQAEPSKPKTASGKDVPADVFPVVGQIA